MTDQPYDLDPDYQPVFGDHDPLLPNRLALLRARILIWQVNQELQP